jgi:hypothetical protein
MKKITWNNVLAYLQGNIRYKLWYSPYKKLIRKHIREQIELRIRFMKAECYNNGVCVKCGCVTTALQMANKECAGRCYPEMMNKSEWIDFSRFNQTYQIVLGFRDSKGIVWKYLTQGDLESMTRYNPKTFEINILYPSIKGTLCGTNNVNN